MQKKKNRFIHVYMNPATYQEFRKKCPDYLFEVLEISNIKYSPKVCHNDFRDFHSFMVTTHIDNAHLMYDVMKQFDCWRQQKFRWNYLPPEPKTKKTPAQNAPIAKATQADKQTPTTGTAPNKGVDISSLTTQAAEEITGAKSNLWAGYHFYNTGYDYLAREEWSNIRNLLESHPNFDGRKLAFIMYAISDYDYETLFQAHPRLHDYHDDDGWVPWHAYLMYGTFISYNTTTRQFEKYPNGWMKIGNGANFEDFYNTLKNNTDKILSVYNDKNQNIR